MKKKKKEQPVEKARKKRNQFDIASRRRARIGHLQRVRRRTFEEPHLRPFNANLQLAQMSVDDKQGGQALALEGQTTVYASFDQVVDLIRKHGGEILKFIGDGLLAIHAAALAATAFAPFAFPVVANVDGAPNQEPGRVAASFGRGFYILDDLTPLDRPFDGADRDESSAP